MIADSICIYILYLNPPLPPNAKVGPLQLPLGDLVLYGIDLLVPWKSSDARRARAMACQGPLHDPVRHFGNPCPVLAAHDGQHRAIRPQDSYHGSTVSLTFVKAKQLELPAPFQR